MSTFRGSSCTSTMSGSWSKEPPPLPKNTTVSTVAEVLRVVMMMSTTPSPLKSPVSARSAPTVLRFFAPPGLHLPELEPQ